jgi:hypothetical protein
MVFFPELRGSPGRIRGKTDSVKLPNPIFGDVQEEFKVHAASYAKRQSSSARL